MRQIFSIGVASVSRAQTITAFDPPNSTTTIASSINLQGQIAGYYSNGDVPHGFLRKRDGSFVTFDAFIGKDFPSNALALDINAAGQVIGFYINSLAIGSFLRRTDGTIVTFSPDPSNPAKKRARAFAGNNPGTTCGGAGSVAVGINDLGQIAGGWVGAGGNCSGYLR